MVYASGLTVDEPSRNRSNVARKIFYCSSISSFHTCNKLDQAHAFLRDTRLEFLDWFSMRSTCSVDETIESRVRRLSKELSEYSYRLNRISVLNVYREKRCSYLAEIETSENSAIVLISIGDHALCVLPRSVLVKSNPKSRMVSLVHRDKITCFHQNELPVVSYREKT